MNERSAHYLGEYLQGRLNHMGNPAIGPPMISYRPVDGVDEYRVLFNVKGGVTSRRVFRDLMSSLGNQREIEFSEGRANIWMSCRLGVAGQYGAPKHDEPPWQIAIWSSPKQTLPECPQYALDDIQQRIESEILGSSSSSDEEVDSDTEGLRDILVKTANVGMTQRNWADLTQSGFISGDGVTMPRSYLSIVHGFAQLVRVQQFAAAVVENIRTVNTIGLVDLSREQVESEGWSGKYLIVFAQTIFGKLS